MVSLTGLADRMLRRDRRTFWLAHPAALRRLREESDVSPASESNLSLRIVEDPIGWMISSRPSRATVAIDLATDFDARSRRVGRSELQRIDREALWAMG